MKIESIYTYPHEKNELKEKLCSENVPLDSQSKTEQCINNQTYFP